MNQRNIVTTYYGPRQTNLAGDTYLPILKRTHGSNPMELLSNIARNIAMNKYGATVVEAHDETYGELLLVVTYDIGRSFQVVFEADRTRPVLITHFPEFGGSK